MMPYTIAELGDSFLHALIYEIDWTINDVSSRKEVPTITYCKNGHGGKLAVIIKGLYY